MRGDAIVLVERNANNFEYYGYNGGENAGESVGVLIYSNYSPWSNADVGYQHMDGANLLFPGGNVSKKNRDVYQPLWQIGDYRIKFRLSDPQVHN